MDNQAIKIATRSFSGVCDSRRRRKFRLTVVTMVSLCIVVAIEFLESHKHKLKSFCSPLLYIGGEESTSKGKTRKKHEEGQVTEGMVKVISFM